MSGISCYQCKKSLDIDYKIGFREECPHCSADLHICLNCEFYDESSYNSCREPSAENVKDKERNNYCEYFQFSNKNQGSRSSERETQLKAAEALFKKN